MYDNDFFFKICLRKEKKKKQSDDIFIDAVTIFFKHFFQRKRKRTIIEQRSGTNWNKLEKLEVVGQKARDFRIESKRKGQTKNIKNQVTVFRNRFHSIRDYRFYSPFATISSVISSHGSHKSQREYYPPLALGGENHRVNA